MSSDDFCFSDRLLDWYDKNGRDLPWRTRGPHPDPYVVWISEIMLQQTTVKTVIPYFERFMHRFPDVFSLAEADIDEVLLFWQGLGYYTRARKLHECAKYITENLDGKFPDNKISLEKLPGIGPYTSSSIAALAFDKPEAIVDGNVIRVVCRYFALSENAYDIRDEILRFAETLMPEKRAADYTSAILDFGATLCTPQNPGCANCPVSEKCAARLRGIEKELPILKKPEKKKMNGHVFLISDSEGRILIRKRTETGLLSGLTEFPWQAFENTNSEKDISGKFNAKATGIYVHHVFTHIDMTLELEVITDSAPEMIAEHFPDGFFVYPSEFEKFAFSTLMKKVIKEAKKKGFFSVSLMNYM